MSLVCVECGNPVTSLFVSYGKDNIVLENCTTCNEISDKYIEFDGVVKAIDLVLHKISIYRHILINFSLKMSWKQILLFFIYLSMIDVHLRQSETNIFSNAMKIFFSSFFINFLYSIVAWGVLKLEKWTLTYSSVLNALMLGSFPQLLHLLFIIWDYPQDIQFYGIISLATITSHLVALLAIQPRSKMPFVAVSLATLITIQLKRN